MAAADMPPLPPGHPVVDGKIHRFGPRKKAWYVLHEYLARNQRRYVAGAFGIWQGAEKNTIQVKSDWAGIEPDEYRRLQASQVQLEVREREKRAARARFASGRAIEQWKAARARLDEGETVPYLARKRLQWEQGLRVAAEGTLLVPMVRYDVAEEQEQDPAYTGPRRLAGLQKIAPDGSKLFNKGMDPVGAACRFGRKPKDGDLLLVGEGAATVLSAFQGIERAYPAFVAFTAGNLLPVARVLRSLYPASPILFLADDDAYLVAQLNKRLRDDYGVKEFFSVDDGERELQGREGALTVRADLHRDAKDTPVLTAGIGAAGGALRTLVLKNAGRTKAWEAAGELGNAWVVWPVFAERKLEPDPELGKLTDFNDLHVTEGLDALVAQLGAEIALIETAHELARGLAAGAPAPATDASGGGDKGSDGEPDWQLHGSLLRRFTQVYPSDEAYDHERGTLVKVAHLRLRFGTRSTGMWLGSPRKRVVDVKNVVFDPTGKADAKTTVNLFHGIAMKPVAGSCQKLLELLQYLCCEAGQDQAPVTEWVLKWGALPLQRPGAKMQTAVVMHGEEGAGKNLFWGAVREIYGEHGGTITQMQLESQFNDWLSAKLFLIANEVVTQQHKRHHVGYLKNLITEPEIWINPKNIGARCEANHANLVFLSNELQPLQIGRGDRRYMVIHTPAALEREFYLAAAAEMEAGGIAALYQHLLELDLAGFDEHTKPIVTEAKEALIEAGLNAAQLYWQDLKDGSLGLPYCPALVDDVYRGFTTWCTRNGEKMPQRINLFVPNFMSMNGVKRIRDRIPNPDLGPRALALAADESGVVLRLRRVFVMGERASDEAAERLRIRQGIGEFRAAVREYVGEGRGREAGPEGSREQAF